MWVWGFLVRVKMTRLSQGIDPVELAIAEEKMKGFGLHIGRRLVEDDLKKFVGKFAGFDERVNGEELLWEGTFRQFALEDRNRAGEVQDFLDPFLRLRCGHC